MDIFVTRQLQTLIRGLIIIAAITIIRFLYSGYKVRRHVRQLQAQGIVHRSHTQPKTLTTNY